MIRAVYPYNHGVSESTRLKNQALEEARALNQSIREAERGLDATPSLQQAYDQAGKTTEPLEQPTPGPTNDRTTSFAKTLDQQTQQVANDRQPQQPGQGSEMVEKDRPAPEPSNTTPEAAAVNKTAFDQAWANEQARADAALQEARDMSAEIKEQEAKTEQDRGPERDRGMG